MKSLVIALQNRFSFGITSIKSSIKFVEIKEPDYKLHSNDLVFHTVRNLRGKKESLEIHFNKIENSISEIFIVR